MNEISVILEAIATERGITVEELKAQMTADIGNPNDVLVSAKYRDGAVIAAWWIGNFPQEYIPSLWSQLQVVSQNYRDLIGDKDANE